MALLQNVIGRGTHAARPAAGSAGLLWFETDTGQLFRDSGSAWQLDDTTLLFTAKGQLLASSASATVGALAAGTDGYVLTADSTQTLGMKWAAGASGGAMTQLDSKSGASATYDFTSISGSYNALRLVGLLRLDAATTDDYLLLKVNGDGTAANYGTQYVSSHSNVMSPGGTVTAVGIRAGDVAGASAPAGMFSPVVIDIPLYANTATDKACTFHSFVQTSTLNTTMYVHQGGGWWLSTAAITQLTLVPGSGSWAANSKVYLYGIT